MIINCPNCNKKFEIDKNLIPFEGRLLQCGICDNKWFFKLENQKKEIEKDEETTKIETKQINFNLSETNENDLSTEENETIETSEYTKEESKKKSYEKKNFNFFKILIVLIISFIALILILDTFKSQFSLVIPNIEIILDNLYQSLRDIKLFILDLIK
tara:strand:+ start:114 stop:587 length:474 start_codon:yes stop_codon:yes gene_type:complete